MPFKYTLTRFCLRSGQLSLPHSMLELFPDEGSVDAEDATNGEPLSLRMLSPRKVDGLGEFMRAHELDVNDQIAIAENDNHFTFTPLPRAVAPKVQKARATAEKVGQILNDLYTKATALSEAEVRDLYGSDPELPLAQALAADERFVLIEGRWHTDLTLDSEKAREPEVPAPLADAEVETSEPSVDLLHHEPDASADNVQGASIQEVLSDYGAKQEQPKPKWLKPKRASVIPYPRGVMFPADVGLNSELESADLSQQKRAKTLLGSLGYRVEGLAHGQLLAHADLGRKRHSILVHVLPEKTKLDWAALLARRRETGADYLAVMGHELDLIPFEAPAELARASLWPWSGVGRLESVLDLVPVSPMDLRSHFERDGLFGKGLERFERAVQARIQERGTFSAVLTRLAAMKAPALFLLDDVVNEDLSREHALAVLENLSQAPFHLVSKVDSGEFCLRFKVNDSLVKLSEFALSLRDRLPNRRTERLHGAPAPTALSLNPQTAHEHTLPDA